jgi:glutamate 5-kinase
MRQELLKDISRIVVKLGTGVLTDARKQPDYAQMAQLASQMAEQHKAGRDIVLVSSGAVGAGMGVLGYDKRPGQLAELQACAAVGQSRLMAVYDQIFGKFGIQVAQVLLTHDDLRHHERHLNARNTLVRLLKHRVVPIINENDAVSFVEIKFGDNDKLSALVACLLPADLLVILTTVDSVIANFGKPNARPIPTIEQITAEIEENAAGTTSATAVGGMSSKIEAAKMAMRAGIPLVIASGRKTTILKEIMAGEEIGTVFVPKPNKLASRKRWIAFFHRPKGLLYVDDGARKALRENGRSLLAPGVAKLEGRFAAGDVVSICDVNGTEFARGISKVDYSQLKLAGSALKDEVIHRDDLVIL